MKHESYTAQLLKLAEIPAETYADPVSRKELRNAVQQALFEISTGLQGTTLNAYHQCCSIEGGDVGWQEAGTLQGNIAGNANSLPAGRPAGIRG